MEGLMLITLYLVIALACTYLVAIHLLRDLNVDCNSLGLITLLERYRLSNLTEFRVNSLLALLYVCFLVPSLVFDSPSTRYLHPFDFAWPFHVATQYDFQVSRVG